jgi:RNA polymerase sigma factor (sigma-70 family)
MAESEAVLLQEYTRTRDGIAFHELVKQHQDMVFAACHRVLGNRTDAEDAAQNCFLKLAQAADRLKAPIGGWLHTVAVRSAIDMLRRKTVRRAHERSAARAVAESRTVEAPWADVRGEVDAAIVALPERLRTPVVLYFLEGHTQAEVAAEIGITRPSVSKRLRRGMERLRRHLKRTGIITSVAALPTMLSGSAAEAAPATLVANLGKMALTATGGAEAAAGGSTLSTLKVGVALVAAAGVGVGTLVLLRPAKAPLPEAAMAIAAATKKKPLTTEEVLNTEFTPASRVMSIYQFARLVKRQTGIRVTRPLRRHGLFVRLEPGRQKLSEALASITAQGPLTTEIVSARNGVAICLWLKPDAEMLARMMKLARSDDALERCTGARWLRSVGGRDALMQLFKMLADPNTRVRHFAARALVDGWTARLGIGSYEVALESPLAYVAPEGTGLVVARAIATTTWREEQQNMVRIARHLRDPQTLPVLKMRLEAVIEKYDLDDFKWGFGEPGWMMPLSRLRGAATPIADVGGPEAEAVLLATMDRLPKRHTIYIMRALGTLGTAGALARLRRQLDIEIRKRKSKSLSYIAEALAASDNPAVVPDLIRILNRPARQKWESHTILPYLSRFDTPRAQAACLAEIRAATDLAERRSLAQTMFASPAVLEEMFGDLAKGGAARRSAARTLATTYDPRLIPALAEILVLDDLTIRKPRRDRAGVIDDTPTNFMVLDEAIRTLTLIGGPEAEKAFIAAIELGPTERWPRAFRALGQLKGPDAQKALLEWAGPQGGAKRSFALCALGNISTPEARKTLMATLQDPDSYIRVFAAQAPVLRGNRVAEECLFACVRMERPKEYSGRMAVSIWAAVAAVGGKRAVNVLMSEVAKGSAPAVLALRSSRDPHCIRATHDAITSDDDALRKLMATAFFPPLPLQNQFDSFEAVLRKLPEARGRQKVETVRRLGGARDARGNEVLFKLLINAKEPLEVRRAAVEALSGCSLGARTMRPIADPAVVPAARHASRFDADPGIRKQAKLILWGVLPSSLAARKRPPPPLPDP